jgi:hypothetical protein
VGNVQLYRVLQVHPQRCGHGHNWPKRWVVRDRLPHFSPTRPRRRKSMLSRSTRRSLGTTLTRQESPARATKWCLHMPWADVSSVHQFIVIPKRRATARYSDKRSTRELAKFVSAPPSAKPAARVRGRAAGPLVLSSASRVRPDAHTAIRSRRHHRTSAKRDARRHPVSIRRPCGDQ